MTAPNLPAVLEALADVPPPGPWAEFGRERQVAFLEALAISGSVRKAAKSVDVGATTVYRARRGDPAFRLAWSGALLAARARSEDELATRAVDGIEEQVLYHGEVVATRRRYDSRLLLAHLARLDKLTEDARTNAFAEDFEAALGRFAAGEPQPEPPAPEGEISSSGQCARCAESNSQTAAEKFAARIRTMNAARPDYAPRPDEFEAEGYDYEDVEYVQLFAFEGGARDWWLVVPSPDDDEYGETRYL